MSRTVVVFACERADLDRASLPANVQLVPVPCVGRVSVPLLLWHLCQGHAGVLVLGRSHGTCRLDGAEEPARRRVQRVERLARLIGQGPDRVCFEEGETGPGGALQTVIRFAGAVVPRSGLVPHGAEACPRLTDESLDNSLQLVDWLLQMSSGHPRPGAWWEAHAFGQPSTAETVLVGGGLAINELLAGHLVAPHAPLTLLDAAAELLPVFGVRSAAVTPCFGWVAAENPDNNVKTLNFSSSGPSSFNELLRQHAADLPRPVRALSVAHFEDEAMGALIEALGHRPISLGTDPLPPRFTLGPDHRVAAEQLLAEAEARGARTLLLGDPDTLLRWSLFCREGSWRSSRIVPHLPLQLAAAALHPDRPLPGAGSQDEEVRP